MPGHRRQFSAQFKAEAVQMVIETGKPIAQVARDLGIHDGPGQPEQLTGTANPDGCGSFRVRVGQIACHAGRRIGRDPAGR
jgi:hypothetical protein